MGNKRNNRIHKIYRKEILNAVRTHGMISRTDINKITDIRMATLTDITAELINEGYLEEVRKPHKTKQLTLKSNMFYSIGIDIQPECLITCLFDISCDIIAEYRYAVKPDIPPEFVFDILYCHIDSIISDYIHSDKILVGIGLSITGMLDVTKSILLSSPQLPKWKNIPIKDIIRKRYEVPVFMDDSAPLNLLVEKKCTNISGCEDIIYVQLGYGIGTGIMSDGKLVRGHQGLAGELGHSVIIPDGKLCTCGNYGCLRTVAKSDEIIAAYNNIVKMCGGESYITDIHTLLTAAENNDKIARNVIDESVRYIGIALANSINMLNPQMVIFGGQMFEKSNYLLDPLINIINRNILPQFTPAISYKIAEHNKYGGAMGAAIISFDSFYNNI